MNSKHTLIAAVLTFIGLTNIANAQLPDPGVGVVAGRTALLITDPQNDFLSPKGVTWGVVGKSVTDNNTVENIESLFKAAKANDIPVFVSPHYYYPTDHGWQFEGALERLMHNIGMFDRKGALTTEGFEGSGADWLNRYKKYINDGATVVSSPHKIYGPETNDLVLQLRKRGIDKVILGGMSANLCTESHMRELMEQGFEVAVVSDATAAAIVEEGNGYESALVNFRFIANTVWTTEQALQKIESVNQKVGSNTLAVNESRLLCGGIRTAGSFQEAKLIMTHRFADIAFTDGVKAAQEHFGSRMHNQRLQENFGPNDQLTPREIEFIAQRDTFYLATVSETDWPYVQHRGGPPGFLKVLGPKQLAYADFRGNTQLISAGNVSKNYRCSLILMDYPNRRRLKILGHMRIEDGRSAEVTDLAKVELPSYKAQVERVVFVDVVAFDWNCPQHITQRYTESEFEARADRSRGD